ncbi:MAG: sulfatase [Synoicihabitans sp.]
MRILPSPFRISIWAAALAAVVPGKIRADYNVLFIIADDLTYTALSSYGNTVCHTPNIDRLAAAGTRFTRAFAQATYCGPSRASFMSGYYPHAINALNYAGPRPQMGDRQSWSQLFKDHGYYSARVSKIYHMGVPGGIEEGSDGADDPLSWTEKFNSPGPEWQAPGDGETLENNPDGKKGPVGGNTFVVVEADGDDLVHSDGKTAAKAVELIHQFDPETGSRRGQKFWLGVGFVRPHVPLVAPASYFAPFKPYTDLVLPEKIPGDWDDIPKLGINYKTSQGMELDIRRQKKLLGGYYASVAYMDAQVGKVLDALEESGLADETIVIFTSDHGYHLGEHDFWSKVSLRDVSSGVPLIIKVPGQDPAVCHSLVELLDLYPTTARLCGLQPPEAIQGKDLSVLWEDPEEEVHDAVFSVAPMRKAFLLRTHDYSFIQYHEDGAGGAELFDLKRDPGQFTNLVGNPEYADVVASFERRLATKLREVRSNDLDLSYD